MESSGAGLGIYLLAGAALPISGDATALASAQGEGSASGPNMEDKEKSDTYQ